MSDAPMTCPTCADAARLRRAFAAAVETYPQNCPMPPAVQAWWSVLYTVVTSSRAGLELIARLNHQEQELVALRAAAIAGYRAHDAPGSSAHVDAERSLPTS